MCVCVCACVRACVLACMHACVLAYVHACVRGYSLKEVFDIDEVEVIRHEGEVCSKACQVTTTDNQNTVTHTGKN